MRTMQAQEGVAAFRAACHNALMYVRGLLSGELPERSLQTMQAQDGVTATQRSVAARGKNAAAARQPVRKAASGARARLQNLGCPPLACPSWLVQLPDIFSHHNMFPIHE